MGLVCELLHECLEEMSGLPRYARDRRNLVAKGNLYQTRPSRPLSVLSPLRMCGLLGVNSLSRLSSHSRIRIHSHKQTSTHTKTSDNVVKSSLQGGSSRFLLHEWRAQITPPLTPLITPPSLLHLLSATMTENRTHAKQEAVSGAPLQSRRPVILHVRRQNTAIPVFRSRGPPPEAPT